MKKLKFLSLFLFLFIPFLSIANGVGSNIELVLKTDFAQFFNISKQGTKKELYGQQKMHYKTGGFQEFNDLYFTVNKSEVLIAASLDLKMEFVLNQKAFGIDILKSFIQDFAHEKDREIVSTLSDRLHQGKGDVAPELDGVLEVLTGKKRWETVHLDKCVFEIIITKETLLINYYYSNWTELPINNHLFLQKTDLDSYKLVLEEDLPSLKSWVSKKNKKAKYSRFVDVRWTFETEEEAVNCYKAYKQEQSEGAIEITDFTTKIGEESVVYYFDRTNNTMIEAFNLDEKYFYFYFRKGKTIAKVFVAIDGKKSVQDAYEIAQKVENLLD